MKKSVLISIVLIIILSLCSVVNAYSTSNYSIDIPSTYESITDGQFNDENGNGINIQVSDFKSSGDPYTQENLDKLVDEIYTNIDQYRDQIAESLKETYGSYYTDEYIKNYVDSFKCNSIDLKEITNVSKNNYKCFHIIANYQMADYSYYCDQYQIVSANEMYTITVSAKEKADLQNDDIKKALESFTIANFSAPANKENNTIKYIAIGAACGAVAGLLSYFFNKNRKNKNDNNINNNDNNVNQ